MLVILKVNLKTLSFSSFSKIFLYLTFLYRTDSGDVTFVKRTGPTSHNLSMFHLHKYLFSIAVILHAFCEFCPSNEN